MLINCFLFLKMQYSLKIWVNRTYFKVTTQVSELICTNEMPLTSVK